MAHPLLALAPIGLTLALILWFKRGPVVSCLVGTLVAVALAKLTRGFALTLEGVALALETSLYLATSVALVVLPGLYLTEVLKGRKVIDEIASQISASPLTPPVKLLILLLGVLPAVESLTGYGVSLFLSVPVLLKLFDTHMTRRLALLGMNIMPWGNLALATLVGASLVGEPVPALGMASAMTSAPVFPLLGLVALHLIGGWSAIRQWGLLAIAMGVSLPIMLFLSSRYLSVETAGVTAGLAVTALTIAGSRLFIRGSGPEGSGPRLARLFAPYLLVFGLILITRVVPPLWDWLRSVGVLRNARVTVSPLASPGVCLLIVALLLQLRPVKINGSALLQRAKGPILATSAFLVLAQVMREAGMIQAVASAVGHLEGVLLWMLVPVVGMVSGFSTGSNLGGNVLLISMQHAAGGAHREALLYAAAHSSAAGHAVFTSLPIIMLVVAITGEGQRAAAPVVRDMLRFGLKTAALFLLGLMAGFALLDRFDLMSSYGISFPVGL